MSIDGHVKICLGIDGQVSLHMKQQRGLIVVPSLTAPVCGPS